MMHYYVILTEAFCNQYKDYKSGANVFSYRVNKDGYFVTSINSLNEFPEIFEGVEVIVVPQSVDDFVVENPILRGGN